VTRSHRFRDGAMVGVLWGLGHAVTLTLAGGVVIALGVSLPERMTTGLELLVAAVLVGLGVFRLRDALRGSAAAAPSHLLSDHDHDGRAAFHSHPHVHGDERHAHPHLHPERSLLRVLGRARPIAGRAIGVGAVHGLAGTAAVSLLVLATLRSPLDGFVYLGVFGLGTMAGMTALTTAMAYPVAFALRFRRAHRALAVASGLGAIVFGVVYAVRVV